MRFFYIYKALAHPELRGYVKPFTLEERLMHVQEARDKLGSQIPWLCDAMSNQVKHSMGDAPNSEFVIDPEGKIVSRRAWSKPDELRRVLSKLVGPVEKPTQISDLDMNINLELPSDGIPTGLVPRATLSGGSVPVKTEPLPRGEAAPYYVKLRSEVDREFFRSGKGQLYLGFHLDRIYKVHWNNLTQPLEFELNVPDGVSVTPIQGSAPKVEAPADRDPREFLLDLAAEKFDQPFGVKVRYFACDDANTFCIPVTQEYSVLLERDRDGGQPRRTGQQRPEQQRPGFGDMLNRLRERDRDGDGRLSREELPESMRQRFSFIDSNGDGFLDESEMQSMTQRGPQSPPQSGDPASRLSANDRNKDGKLSPEEVPPPMRERFEQMDRNRDGFLDVGELEQAMRSRSSRGPRRPTP